MGKAVRDKPARLAEKLLEIRVRLDLSQNEMLRLVDSSEKLTRVDISKYERGLREPSLLVLLGYARAVGTTMEVLVDDKIELP